MKARLLAFCAAFLFSAVLLAGLPEALESFTGVTNKPALSYEIGEPMIFTLNFGEYNNDVPAGTKIFWLRRGDDGKTVDGNLTWDPAKPATIETALGTEGFVWIVAYPVDENKQCYKDAKGNKVEANLGAGVHPENLRGVDEPADFDEYWAKQKALLATVPLKYTMDPVKKLNGSTIYAVSIDCAGGRPATGYLNLPDELPAKSLSATLSVMGYNYSAWLGQVIPNWPPRRDTILFQINAHGMDLMKDDAYYEEFGKKIQDGAYGYAFSPRQNANPDTAYFHGMVLRVLRALEFLKSLPQWNGELIVEGGSQGGLQTVWAAALDHDVTLAKPGIPWECDVAGQSEFGRLFGPWKLPYVPALNYYDCINHAKRIQCPVIITRAGLGDYVCPPSGVAILYNNLKCKKEIHWYQNSTHGTVPKQQEIFTFQEEKQQ